MKKKIALLMLLIANPLMAAAKLPPRPALDKVVFQLSAKQWVSTQSALLVVNVNAALSNAGLVKTKEAIMSELGKIASGEWHLTRFDRSQDSSGLDKLFVEAQLRVPQSALSNIYDNAKKVSKPGATYTINSVEFKPSLEEIQATKAQLRQRLYQMVNEEISRMNKVYTQQHYTVNRLYFFEGEASLPMEPRAYRGQAMKTMMLAAAPAPALTVSNELILTAMVEAASNREEGSNLASTTH